MINVKNFIAVLLAAGAVFLFSRAVPAQLDPTFGTGGVSVADIYAADVPVKPFALAGGRLLVLERNTAAAAGGQLSFVRFAADGALDASYGTNGVKALGVPFLSPLTAVIADAARQPDGRVVIVGADNGDGFVARYNEDGTLDASFADGGVHRPNIDQTAADRILGVAVQPDGKLLVAGATGAPDRLFLMRYHPNGLLDVSFGDGGFIVHNLGAPLGGAPALQSNGRILVPAAAAATATGAALYRFEANGRLDAAFAPIAVEKNLFGDLKVQPDDKILVADAVIKSDVLERVHRNLRVFRYAANGAPDAGFGANGSTAVDVGGYFDDYTGRIVLLPDGQIVVSGAMNVTPNRSRTKGSYFSLIRLAADGALNGNLIAAGVDSSFLPGTKAPEIVAAADGKILGVTARAQGANGSDLLLARVTGVPRRQYRFKANPFDFGSFDSFVFNDGRADIAVFRENQSNWYINPLADPFYFGLPGDIPIPADYLKDYGAEIAIYRPTEGMWYIGRNYYNPGRDFIAIRWGRAGDIPIPFDYDGDSKDDLALFRPSDGTWYIRNLADDSVSIVRWGMDGDKPVPGDYDGDGKYDIAVFRPSNGVWYVLRSSDARPMYYGFGAVGDIPVQEDFDADGITDMAVWRPSTGVWYISRSSDGRFAFFEWGIAGDVPTPSDFDGDLKTDIAVWRPSTRSWYIYQSGSNTSQIYQFGLGTDVPVQKRQ